jgi:tetratricopeptide (TPR) repeat protein
MDIKTALNILKINSFKDFEDIKLNYYTEVSKATNSYNNAFNETVKNTYSQKIDDLNKAFNFIDKNKADLKKKASFEAPTIKITPGQKRILIIVGIVLIGISSFLGIRAYRAHGLVTDGLQLYEVGFRQSDAKFYEQALDCFKKANDLGSTDGKFYLGKTIYWLADAREVTQEKALKQEGLNYMGKAVENGFEAPNEMPEYYRLINKSLND